MKSQPASDQYSRWGRSLKPAHLIAIFIESHEMRQTGKKESLGPHWYLYCRSQVDVVARTIAVTAFTGEIGDGECQYSNLVNT